MYEWKEHQVYELLEGRYERVGLDYVILQIEEAYEGRKTHQKAVIEAFAILNERFRKYELHYDADIEKMCAVKIEMEEFLQPCPPEFDGRYQDHCAYAVPSPLPYSYAFLDPPYGTPYINADFLAFNELLFPNREACEVYRWNDEFSAYFAAGKEWWGTGMWSVYDAKTGIIVVIGASLTD